MDDFPLPRFLFCLLLSDDLKVCCGSFPPFFIGKPSKNRQFSTGHIAFFQHSLLWPDHFGTVKDPCGPNACESHGGHRVSTPGSFSPASRPMSKWLQISIVFSPKNQQKFSQATLAKVCDKLSRSHPQFLMHKSPTPGVIADVFGVGFTKLGRYLLQYIIFSHWFYPIQSHCRSIMSPIVSLIGKFRNQLNSHLVSNSRQNFPEKWLVMKLWLTTFIPTSVF